MTKAEIAQDATRYALRLIALDCTVEDVNSALDAADADWAWALADAGITMPLPRTWTMETP